MTHEHLQLIERTRRLLDERGLACTIGGAASDAAIDAAEEALECTLPPSYRAFLRAVGTLSLPDGASTIQQFVGISGTSGASDGLVARTQSARATNRLGDSFVIVALGAEPGEWFCVDTDHARPDGECPVYLFDARDNQLDQQFYDDFAAMVIEVLTFVRETVDEGAEVGAEEPAGETSLGGMY